MCDNIVHQLMSSHVPSGYEPTFLVWSQPHCKGVMYPPRVTEDEQEFGPFSHFGLSDQELDAEDLQMDQIGSVFIPPHQSLKIWSGDHSGYFEIAGPNVVTSTESLLLQHWHGNVTGEPQPGRKIDWTFGSGPNQIHGITFHRYSHWHNHLGKYAPQKQAMRVGRLRYATDWNQVHDEWCQDKHANPALSHKCDCVHAFWELEEEHGEDMAREIPLNLLKPNCDPTHHHVPKGAKVGRGTLTECMTALRKTIHAGTHKFLDGDGPELWRCGEHVIHNTDQHGNQEPTNRFSDWEEDLRERREMQRTSPWAAHNVSALVVLVLVFTAICVAAYYFTDPYRYDVWGSSFAHAHNPRLR